MRLGSSLGKGQLQGGYTCVSAYYEEDGGVIGWLPNGYDKIHAPTRLCSHDVAPDPSCNSLGSVPCTNHGSRLVTMSRG